MILYATNLSQQRRPEQSVNFRLTAQQCANLSATLDRKAM